MRCDVCPQAASQARAGVDPALLLVCSGGVTSAGRCRSCTVTCVFRRRHKRGPVSILQGLVDDEVASRAPHIVLIDQLFAFIGSNPEKAVRGACWQNAHHSISYTCVCRF